VLKGIRVDPEAEVAGVTDRPTFFLSSTVMDLGVFRDAAVHVCQRLGIGVTTMEEFGPDPRAAVAVCREKVERGLYAHRYGFVPEGFGGRSITQLEYEWAVARGLPVLRQPRKAMAAGLERHERRSLGRARTPTAGS
jgi:Domain of unknown function (DUF4062)